MLPCATLKRSARFAQRAGGDELRLAIRLFSYAAATVHHTPFVTPLPPLAAIHATPPRFFCRFARLCRVAATIRLTDATPPSRA